MNKFVALLGAICFTLFLTLGCVVFIANFEPFYHMGGSPKENTTLLTNVLNYLQGKNNLSEEFTPREKEHMQDVKGLLLMVTYAWVLFGLVAFLIMGNAEKAQLKGILKSTGMVLVAIVILILVAGVFFSKSFELFHQIAFRPGTWTFPQNSTLLTLFPLRYFKFALFTIGGFNLTLALILWKISKKSK